MSSTGTMGRRGPKISLIWNPESVNENKRNQWSRMDDEPFEEGIAFLDVPVDRRGDASPFLIRVLTDDDLRRGSLH
jgi:hypothetical protein